MSSVRTMSYDEVLSICTDYIQNKTRSSFSHYMGVAKVTLQVFCKFQVFSNSILVRKLHKGLHLKNPTNYHYSLYIKALRSLTSLDFFFQDHDLHLLMYEGGQHIVEKAPYHTDVTSKLTNINRNVIMETLNSNLLNIWNEIVIKHSTSPGW